MKISIFFKTPDVLYYALEDIKDEEQKREIKEKLSKWIEYGEGVTLTYDSDKDEMTVERLM